MTWLQRYNLRSFVRSAFWPAPVLSMACALVALPLVRDLDAERRWTLLGFTSQGASAILSAFSASMLTFMVFVMSSLLLVVQLASAQMTPRIIAPAFQHRAVRIALCLFVFAYIFSLGVLGRVSNEVPQLGVLIAILANITSIASFLYFIGSLGMSLRPIVIIANLAASARRSILDVYPSSLSSQPEPIATKPGIAPFRVINHSGRSGVLMAVDIEGLVEIGAINDCLIELLPRVGDDVSEGDAIFNLYGNRAPESELLAHSIAIGSERTLQQDPVFAFRVLGEIACRALSPAINDPATAVLVLDQLQHLLFRVGQRQLDAGVYSDGNKQVRLICSTPDWEDFVTVAVTVIRRYGAGSLQVARRLRAMLDHLLTTLPPLRAEPLREELRLLHLDVITNFIDLHERARAEIGDFQGVGGRKINRTAGVRN